MQYMLLLTNSPDSRENTEAEPRDEVFDDWGAYTRALHEAGVLVAGAGLHAPDTATTVQVRAGERLVTDGPFTDSKEHLIGFYLLDLPDLDAALDWAAKVPSVRTGTVEVRPVPPETETRAALAA